MQSVNVVKGSRESRGGSWVGGCAGNARVFLRRMGEIRAVRRARESLVSRRTCTSPSSPSPTRSY